MNLGKWTLLAVVLGLELIGAQRINAQETDDQKNELSVPIFDVNYVRDNMTFQRAKVACSEELKIAGTYKSELLEKHPELLASDLEVQAFFGETYENGGTQPSGARCVLKFYVLKNGYSLRLFDSPEKDKPEECRPYLEQNRRDHLVLWQRLLTGWSFFQGNWCVVRAVEVLGQ